jgi:hypothetical protein
MEYFETVGNLLDTAKILLHYFRRAGISVSFPTKCRLFHGLILFGSNDINVFCNPCAKI